MADEHDEEYMYGITDEDIQFVTRGIYTSNMVVRDQHGTDHPMLEMDMFMSDGNTHKAWIPMPLVIGIMDSCVKLLKATFPPQTFSEAEFSDDAIREMAENFAREFRDANEDPFPDRKHDDPDE